MTNATTSIRDVLLMLCTMCAVFAQPALAGSDIRTERVQFAKGATSAVVSGTIKGYQTVDYVLHASQGQHIGVSMKTDNTASYFNILAPGETEVAFFIGSVSDNRYEGELPATGDYRIRVYMMRSAARRNEVANYRLDMAVTAPARVSASHDALVPGTGFHATAKIPCVAEPNKPVSQCDAGVKRTTGGGSVQVSTPDGGSRTIVFRDGQVISTDADATFKVERRDDWTIVRIGAVEVYEIPDAFISGG